MHELTQLIKDDMRPALGVTEPGAIAYAVSKAKSYVQGELEQVTLLLNSGMYKNAYTFYLCVAERIFRYIGDLRLH